MRIHKKGIRTLGISESLVDNSEKSIIAGVVIRTDMILDGFTFSRVMVGGMDATKRVIEMFYALGREDINFLLLNGCVISWFNVLDLNYLAEIVGLPFICVTYKESRGLEGYFKEYFPEDWRSRVEVYHRNGPRTPLKLQTGHLVYARFLHIGREETMQVLNKFTLHGAVPEPLRIARLIARSLMKSTNILGVNLC